MSLEPIVKINYETFILGGLEKIRYGDGPDDYVIDNLPSIRFTYDVVDVEIDFGKNKGDRLVMGNSSGYGITQNLLKAFYERISRAYTLNPNVSDFEAKKTYFNFWAKKISDFFQFVVRGLFVRNFGFKTNEYEGSNGRKLFSITPDFSFRYLCLVEGGFIDIEPIKIEQVCIVTRNNFVSYVPSEGSGFILFTPEYNSDTEFDNFNFGKVIDDDFTKDIGTYISDPQFEKAMFIRPRKYYKEKKGKCKKCKKCKKSYHKTKITKYTTAPFLQEFVISAFNIYRDVYRNLLSSEEGINIVNERYNYMKPFLAEGFTPNFTQQIEDGRYYLMLCARFRLKTNDAILGFILENDDDLNDIILKISNVPIDEDMDDSNYPLTTPFSTVISDKDI